MDETTQTLVAELRDRQKTAVILGDYDNVFGRAADKIEDLHKMAYLTIPLPSWFNRIGKKS